MCQSANHFSDTSFIKEPLQRVIVMIHLYSVTSQPSSLVPNSNALERQF